MTGKLYLLAVVGVVIVLCAGAFADTVTMKSGDVLTGKVISLSDGAVTLKTEYMGEVKINFTEVKSITTDEPLLVTSTDGAGAVGRIEYAAGEGVAVITPAGTAVVPEAQIASMWPPDKGPEAPRWKGSLELGINGQEGNRSTFSGSGAIKLRREVKADSVDVYALARYAKEDGTTSANQQRAGVRFEHQLTDSPYFWYYALDFFRDEFQDIEFRATPSAGLRRVWWKKGNDWWKTGVGLGLTYESYMSGGNDLYPIAELRSDYSKELAPNLIFGDVTVVTPDLSSLEGWRAENEAALSFVVNANWRLKLALTHRYENDPEPGIERLDTYYVVNAVRTF